MLVKVTAFRGEVDMAILLKDITLEEAQQHGVAWLPRSASYFIVQLKKETQLGRVTRKKLDETDSRLALVLSHLFPRGAEDVSAYAMASFKQTRNHWTKTPPSFVSEDGVTWYIVGFTSMHPDFDNQQFETKLHIYRLDATPEGLAYVVDMRHSSRILPLTWLEFYYPGATKKLHMLSTLHMDQRELIELICNDVIETSETVLPEL